MTSVKLRALAVVFLAALLPVGVAFAYIPPSSFIIKSVASKHAGFRGLRIRSMVTMMDGDKPGATRFKATTYFNPQTGVLHAYAYDERNQKLYAVERREDSATAADALLFWHDEHNVANALKARGIPIRTEDELLKMKDEEERRTSEEAHLARWNGAIAWVLSSSQTAQPPGPQLWIEKDTFLPLRLVAAPRPESDPSDLVDLQFEGQHHYHEFPYPKTITAIQKKVPLFRDEVQDVSVALDNAEFRQPVVPGFTESGNSAPNALRELIQKYFEVLR